MTVNNQISENEKPKGLDDGVDRVLAEAQKPPFGFHSWWLGYLLANPDVTCLGLYWIFTVLYFARLFGDISFLRTVITFVIGTILVSIAPCATILYQRRKQSGLDMAEGWKKAWAGDRKPLFMAIGISAVLVFLKLTL